MHWQDEAIILKISPFSEHALRLDVLSAEHGRYAGIVKGGASKSKKHYFDIGNILFVTWRARLSEQMGSFTVELLQQPAAAALHDPIALSSLNAATALLLQKLPERHAEPELYACYKTLLAHLPYGMQDYLPLYIAFEMHLLAACGFPLDLRRCAATGQAHSLRYVSPKSGRAVSADAGEPYKSKLFKLPDFLTNDVPTAPSVNDLRDALVITSHFLSHHANEITHKPLPSARDRLLSMLSSIQCAPAHVAAQ